MGGRRTEERHHGIAHVLINPTTVGGNHRVKTCPERIHHRADFFGVHRLDHCREARNVSEEHGDLLTLLRGARLLCL